MRFDPQLAEIRFGCGLSPHVAPPASVAQMMARVRGPDTAAARFPIETFQTFETRIAAVQVEHKLRRKKRGTPRGEAATKAARVLNQEARIAHVGWFGQHLNRWVTTDAPLRERLCAFWADHFTATGKAGLMRRATSPYMQTAIRPHLTGLFEDLLRAAVLHPLMVHYLDQERSVGPNSKQAARGGKLTGLNENLAREVLELHTLGVNGPYTQGDVRELAELLTGVAIDPPMRLKFRKDRAEPGSETVLGRTYGGPPPISATCMRCCAIWPAIPPPPGIWRTSSRYISPPTRPIPRWSPRWRPAISIQTAILAKSPPPCSNIQPRGSLRATT